MGLLTEALEIQKQLLGSAHPDVATSLNNLAFIYSSQGRYDQVEPLYIEALEIQKQLLGQEHPHTQTVQENYLIFLQKVQIENLQDSLSNEMSLQMISQRSADLGE